MGGGETGSVVAEWEVALDALGRARPSLRREQWKLEYLFARASFELGRFRDEPLHDVRTGRLSDRAKGIRLYGAGDVLGFNDEVICRLEPKRDIGDFEPNYFPYVEFADAP